MPAKKIVVTDFIADDLEWERGEIENRGGILEYHQMKYAGEDELLEKIQDADMIYVNMAKLPGSLIRRLNSCRRILRHGIGYDNVDVAACTAMNILFSNIPDYCSEDVAEQTVALIFATARKIYQMRAHMPTAAASGRWDFAAVLPFYRLEGKILGIVGCGRIGSRVLAKMSAMNMTMMVCDPYLSEEKKKELGVQTYPLAEVLKEAHVVTLHTPLNEETHHLIDEPQLRLMKKTSFLVNTSRGATVNNTALIKALKEGWIAGAGIDVVEGREPPPPDSEWYRTPNVLLTPHMGWYSEESSWSLREKMLDESIRFIEDRPPRYLVNMEVLDRIPDGQERYRPEFGPG